MNGTGGIGKDSRMKWEDRRREERQNGIYILRRTLPANTARRLPWASLQEADRKKVRKKGEKEVEGLNEMRE